MTPQALSSTDAARFAHLEARVERGLKSFLDVGLALLEIRDGKLYRADFPTFADYLAARWGISRARGYQLLGAAEVAENLSTTVDKTAEPTHERQVRPLVGLPAKQQVAVWKESVATAPTDKAGKPRVTMAHVAATLSSSQPGKQLALPIESQPVAPIAEAKPPGGFTCPRCGWAGVP